MKIHEYQAMELLDRFGVPHLPGCVAETADEALEIAKEMMSPRYAVKAQVHAGGRGKSGGVKLASSPEEVYETAEKMIGMTLVTKQTGAAGKLVRRVLICKAIKISREHYISMTFDYARNALCLMTCAEGGIEIENVAEKTPEKIKKTYINNEIGIRGFHISNIAADFGLDKAQTSELGVIIRGLYRMFFECDCTMLEVNPLVIAEDGHIYVLDLKTDFDSNALFRHPDIAALRDPEEEDRREAEAAEFDLNYIGLDGSIGCMVNGAGLAMATMDAISYYGGKPANFLDVGGGATKEKIAGAFRIITSDPGVKGIFVNIFGGIMRCDILAAGIVEAASEMSLSIPIVIRMQGTNREEGMRILSESGLDIVPEGDLGRAVKLICELTSGKESRA